MNTILLLAAAAPAAEGHEGPVLWPFTAEGWVYVSVTIFLVALFWFFKAHHRVRDALDQRIADTRKQLDDAKSIRAEAERLLAEARAKHAASAGDAQAIVAHAEQEAAQMLAKAEKDAAELVERRGRMAEDKIAAAERAALAEVRAKAADAAAKAAGTLIAGRHGPDADKALVDRTIAGLARSH